MSYKQGKVCLDDLAAFGGEPAFTDYLHVGRPNIGHRERLLERINGILDRRWLTNAGPCVQELEQELANKLGVKHCIAMCNGSVALEIAIRALGLTGEVIIPSFTFIATAHALQWQEITPVFCDIDPDTHTIDPQRVEELITPRTTGIIGVHLWGRACDIDALADIARRRNLTLLFDAAHAFACSYKGRMIGNFGEAEVFSFHATKFFNSLEGGAIATNNDDLAAKIRLMKNFGFAGMDKVVYIGTNGKMNEISAAMALTGLEDLEDFVATNRHNYLRYEEALSGLPGVRLLRYDDGEKYNYQYIVLEIDEGATQIGRDRILEILRAENVLARRYFYPGCHRMEPYRSYFPHAGLLLHETEEIAKKVLVLPTGSAVEPSEIDTVCEIVRLVIDHAPLVQERFQEHTLQTV